MHLLDRVTRLEARAIHQPIDLWAKIERYRRYFAGEPVELSAEERFRLAEHDRFFEELK